jgi:outer membrane protein assembly factor BamD
MRKTTISLLLACCLLVTIGSGCRNTQLLTGELGSAKILELGKQLLDQGKYKQAREYFYHLVNFYPGTNEAAEAQYLLSKSYFDQGKYENALVEFEVVIDRYPNCEYVDDAYYFIGCCYLNESPDLQRDLSLVQSAIDNFNTVILDYELSNRLDEAKQGLLSARNKLAQKEFYIARFYLSSKKYSAASIYFQDIAENYGDTLYVGDSIYYLGECKQKGGDIEEAKTYYQQYLSSYPYGNWVKNAQDRLAEISKNP